MKPKTLRKKLKRRSPSVKGWLKRHLRRRTCRWTGKKDAEAANALAEALDAAMRAEKGAKP